MFSAHILRHDKKADIAEVATPAWLRRLVPSIPLFTKTEIHRRNLDGGDNRGS